MIFVCLCPRNFLKQRSVEDDAELYLSHLKKFSLEELQVATNRFSDEQSSKVYKGVLQDGSVVTVKRLRSEDTPGGKLQFEKVMEVISAAAHQNLLQLLGICITSNERLLVYPYRGAGTVASHLRDESSLRPSLNWLIRKQIALASAKGICYLHEQCNPKIIHGGVTAANILLNEDFDVFVGDFALANLIDKKDTYIITPVRGTIGYMAPEFVSRGMCSEKIDVYGFGIVLLELITGQKAFDISRLSNGEEIMLLDWVTRVMKENKLEKLVDPYLYNNYLEVEVEQLIQVAILCTDASPVYRPKMSEVVRMVENIGFAEKWDDWQNKDISSQELNQVLNLVATFDSTQNLNAVELSGPR